jgi:hypothetical protein
MYKPTLAKPSSHQAIPVRQHVGVARRTLTLRPVAPQSVSHCRHLDATTSLYRQGACPRGTAADFPETSSYLLYAGETVIRRTGFVALSYRVLWTATSHTTSSFPRRTHSTTSSTARGLRNASVRCKKERNVRRFAKQVGPVSLFLASFNSTWTSPAFYPPRSFARHYFPSPLISQTTSVFNISAQPIVPTYCDLLCDERIVSSSHSQSSADHLSIAQEF